MTSRCALIERLPLNAAHLTTKPTLPAFLYGTAWKKENTTDLVYKALKHGFTAIDTAAQPKHYREDLVGRGLRQAIQENIIKRTDVFVQTKFTSVDGQDPNNMPYKAEWPVAEQVKHSIQSSLRNFDCTQEGDTTDPQPAYLDSVVLHSPLRTLEDTMEAWRTLESFVPHQIRSLGISNTNLYVLQTLYEKSKIKPTVVQNRFYPATKFDVDIRKYCKEKGIIYQSFWTLSANPELLKSQPVKNIASQAGVDSEAALYCCVLGLEDTVILNGTKSVDHMQEDWKALDRVKDYVASNSSVWEAELSKFKTLISQP